MINSSYSAILNIANTAHHVKKPVSKQSHKIACFYVKVEDFLYLYASICQEVIWNPNGQWKYWMMSWRVIQKCKKIEKSYRIEKTEETEKQNW